MEIGARRLRSLISEHHYLSVFLFILAVKIVIWGYSLGVSHRVPVTRLLYFSAGHHYQMDPRITEGRVDFLSIWIYSDAEWYLSIAANGYPNTEQMAKAAAEHNALKGYPYRFARGDPAAPYRKYTEWDKDAKYAFFPLYPLSIAALHSFLPLHVAAFVGANAISAFAFLALYALVLEYFSDKGLAFRSLLLLMFYPFSVFYQAYYSEGLFLLLAVLSFYFLKKGRVGLSVLCGALLALTRPTGAVIVVPLLVLAIKQGLPAPNRATKRAEKLRRHTGVRMSAIDWSRCRIACLAPLGLVPYLAFNYFQTGHWNYFAMAQKRWGYEGSAFLGNLLNNILVAGSNFFRMPFLTGGHDCQVDYLAMAATLAILVLSYKRLPLELWTFSALQWFVPCRSRFRYSSTWPRRSRGSGCSGWCWGRSPRASL
jgi:Mannosyltransferase (PIG-V)